ncbi:MAG TPA: hypothetical protein VIL30_22520, partial [Ramlibacter sp.]
QPLEVLSALARLHAHGAEVPWQQLFAAGVRRASVPGYAFAREHYWLAEPEIAAPAAVRPATIHPAPRAPVTPAPAASAQLQRLHAWLAAPEQARAAAQERLARPVRTLGQLVWGRSPAPSAQPLRWMEEGDALLYELAHEHYVHFGEVLPTVGVPALQAVQLGRLRAGMKPVAPPQPQVETLWGHGSQRLAALQLRTSVREGFAAEALHAACGVAADWLGETAGTPWLPLAARRIESLAPLPQDAVLQLARKQQRGGSCSFDLRFYTRDGQPCLRVDDFTVTNDPALLGLLAEGR